VLILVVVAHVQREDDRRDAENDAQALAYQSDSDGRDEPKFGDVDDLSPPTLATANDPSDH